MAHHLSHAKEHEPHHEHYVCPQCSGQGFIDKEPGKEQEKEALHRYAEDLKQEVRAAEDRIKEL
jgi:hypothetical protein